MIKKIAQGLRSASLLTACFPEGESKLQPNAYLAILQMIHPILSRSRYGSLSTSGVRFAIGSSGDPEPRPGLQRSLLAGELMSRWDPSLIRKLPRFMRQVCAIVPNIRPTPAHSFARAIKIWKRKEHLKRFPPLTASRYAIV